MLPIKCGVVKIPQHLTETLGELVTPMNAFLDATELSRTTGGVDTLHSMAGAVTAAEAPAILSLPETFLSQVISSLISTATLILDHTLHATLHKSRVAVTPFHATRLTAGRCG